MYNKKILYQQCVKAIADGGLFSLLDVAAVVGVAIQTLYNKFPNGSAERASLERLLLEAKRKTIRTLRFKMLNSDNPNAWTALYKQLCTQQERIDFSSKSIDANVRAEVDTQQRRIDRAAAAEFIAEFEAKYGEKSDDDD